MPKILLEALSLSGPISCRSLVWSSKPVLLCLSQLRYLPVLTVLEYTIFRKDAGDNVFFSSVSQ